MDLCSNRQPNPLSRRDMLRSVACGFGYMAFAGMANAGQPRILLPQDDPFAPKSTHHPATAKRVIFLCMAGGPSHVDTFDYKPELARMQDKTYRRNAKLLPSPWNFRQRGESGLWVSDLFPEVGDMADDMVLLRSMKAAIPAHAQATTHMHTGSFQFVRPSLGAWSFYGLGTMNENLPGFVTINPRNGGAVNYGASFLPATYQGTPMNLGNGRRAQPSEDPIEHINNDRIGKKGQEAQLDLLRKLERERARRERRDPEVESVLKQYELAFRMQAEVPELVDMTKESKKTLEMYGIGEDATDGFGRQCLLARKLAEEGVRFIEVTHGGWDTHRNLRTDLERQCGAIDKPIAALLSDLKTRGMLDDTLVLWGGEFGRTPYAQNGDGRDHNAGGFSMWMAGGGVKGGMSYGSTDETGNKAVENVMDIHDWHATILHLMGMNHERLTFNHAGRDFRLTDIHGNIHKDIIA